MIQSEALEANIQHVEIVIDPKYALLQEIMGRYFGLMDKFNNFLEELSHPLQNWQFIVKEARGYCLDYFHLIKKHEKGPEAVWLFADIFFDAIKNPVNSPEVKGDAIDNLLLFIKKIIGDSGGQLEKFCPVLDNVFEEIHGFDENDFFLFVKSYYRIKDIAALLLKTIANTEKLLSNSAKPNIYLENINYLIIKYFNRVYECWLKEDDPEKWLLSQINEEDRSQIINQLFDSISHSMLHKYKNELQKISFNKTDPPEIIPGKLRLERLIKLPGYHHFVETYREIPRRMFQAGLNSDSKIHWRVYQNKLICLFHIMKIPGLSLIHEGALRDINMTLSRLISQDHFMNVEKLMGNSFIVLRDRVAEFPSTVLNCVLNMGKAVYKTDESDMINFFIDNAVSLGFQSPMIGGVGDDWQIKANQAHIQNIRTWMELIEIMPKWSTRLLSGLIIHLTLCGVFIKDTDLFPRDITRFLNSEIEPVYNLCKQLARLFPTYFNDIGAEGLLRDISTEIDEITHRKDVLIHFLRKQTHVESSNRIIGFMESVISFWLNQDKKELKPFLPPAIYKSVENRGVYIDGVNKLVNHIAAKGIDLPKGLLSITAGVLDDILESTEAGETDKKRIKLAVSLYQLLDKKYNLAGIEMTEYISRMNRYEAFPEIDELLASLQETDIKKKISGLLDYLESLKKIILSEQQFEVREDIYKKRHFTIDIPSMYGSYHELKFDALGLTFRIESILNILFEQLTESIDLSIITKATFFQIHQRLGLFNRALAIDGISSVELERQLELLAHSLDVKGFTFTQYLDIFKGLAQAVRNIIDDNFNNIHEYNLNNIISGMNTDNILPRYLPGQNMTGQEIEGTRQENNYKITEIFLREKIALSLGLQQLDVFITRILKTLFHQSSKLDEKKLHLLLNYDPHHAMMTLDESASSKANGIIYLGNKGVNLVRMNDFGLPVPPCFIVTTEVFRCLTIIDEFARARQNFEEQITKRIRTIERVTGKRFADPKNPLLFSVRSGSSISQPGMMDTFLNVGINEDIATGLAVETDNAFFAWDCYRRFLQGWGMSYGIDRNDFDALIAEAKKKQGVSKKRLLGGEGMKKVALAYKSMIYDYGYEIIEKPFDQLLYTIKSVLESWESDKAKIYRKIMGISDDWGTAVTIQAMVFGNMSQTSGTGVFFTHNPRQSGGGMKLWGDFTVEDQGEDVVSGLVNTMPISISQQNFEKRSTDIILETHFPEIYTTLREWAGKLIYEKGWGPQEMEFTFESPSKNDLHLLQTRDMAMRKHKKVTTFHPESIEKRKKIGNGIGVSGGAMSGRVVFTLEEIDRWRKKEPKTHLILIRGDTVPDDISEIFAADGLLTARGGLTSHAAVVAHRLGKTCVVGCGNLECNEDAKKCAFDSILLKSGDKISIDGHEGSVYEGDMKFKENQSRSSEIWKTV